MNSWRYLMFFIAFSSRLVSTTTLFTRTNSSRSWELSDLYQKISTWDWFKPETYYFQYKLTSSTFIHWRTNPRTNFSVSTGGDTMWIWVWLKIVHINIRSIRLTVQIPLCIQDLICSTIRFGDNALVNRSFLSVSEHNNGKHFKVVFLFIIWIPFIFCKIPDVTISTDHIVKQCREQLEELRLLFGLSHTKWSRLLNDDLMWIIYVCFVLHTVPSYIP